MRLQHLRAVRYETVLQGGRTQPLVLACRSAEEGPEGGRAEPKVVKALGCPEIGSQRQLIAEVVGNAIARRMGIVTPDPCIVRIDEPIARLITTDLRTEGFAHELQAGPAAGCERLTLAPYTVGQSLTPEQRTQAAQLYVFDMLSQNPDRRASRVNCAVTGKGLVAFDFESCFQHLFVPIIGGREGEHWEPSRSRLGPKHLFHDIAKANPMSEDRIGAAVSSLSQEWWEELLESLPAEWRDDASMVGEVVRSVAEHTREFVRDISWSFA